MRARDSFTVRDSMGDTYRVVEYETPEGMVFRTEDGYAVEMLDRHNFVIKKRNPRTHERTISVYR